MGPGEIGVDRDLPETLSELAGSEDGVKAAVGAGNSTIPVSNGIQNETVAAYASFDVCMGGTVAFVPRGHSMGSFNIFATDSTLGLRVRAAGFFWTVCFPIQHGDRPRKYSITDTASQMLNTD